MQVNATSTINDPPIGSATSWENLQLEIADITVFDQVTAFALSSESAQQSRLASISFSTDATAVDGTLYRTAAVGLGVFTVPAIPEPETYALMMAGLGIVNLAARRRKATTA
jgi:hypothetical protein